jgi:hypothetical protein
MFVIVGVPRSVVATLLQSWIGYKSLARLDAAVCCRTERPKLLSILCSVVILDTTSLPAANARTCNRYLEWLTSRKIKVNAWVFHQDLDQYLVIDFTERTGGDHVHTLCLSGMKEETAAILFAIMSSCRRVCTVSFKDTEHWTGLCVAREAARQSLQELSVIDCGTNSSRPFKPESLPRLQKLHLNGAYTALTVNSLLEAAPALTDLRLKNTLVDDDWLHRSWRY